MKKLLSALVAVCVVAGTSAAQADGMSYRGSLKDSSEVQSQPSWSGVYIGAFAGASRAKDKWNSDETYFDSYSASLSSTGFTGGGLIGANLQTGRAVWGVELDLGYSNLSMSKNYSYTDDNDYGGIKSELNLTGHARLRFGLAMGRFMPFVAGGLAFANTDVSLNWNGEITPKKSLTRVGYSLGGGLDWQVRDNILARVEYIHDSYGSVGFGEWGDSQYMELQNDTVRAAIIFKID